LAVAVFALAQFWEKPSFLAAAEDSDERSHPVVVCVCVCEYVDFIQLCFP